MKKLTEIKSLAETELESLSMASKKKERGFEPLLPALDQMLMARVSRKARWKWMMHFRAKTKEHRA